MTIKISEYLQKKNRVWEIHLVSPSSNKAKVITKSGIINGKIRSTKPTVFKGSKRKSARDLARTFYNRKIRERKHQGYSNKKNIRPIKTSPLERYSKKRVIRPMKASLLEGREDNIRYPVYVQAKLDGYRGMATCVGSKIKILSKNGIPFPHLDIIKRQLNSFPLFSDKSSVYLDGEIYIRNGSVFDIRRILGRKSVNTNYLKDLESKIKFYIFDWFDLSDIDKPFSYRWKKLKEAMNKWNLPVRSRRVSLVPTIIVIDKKMLQRKKISFIREGYEGVIIRNYNGLYLLDKRSPDVLRSKEFKKDIFRIKDAKEGRGDDKGTVIWVMECLKDKNKSFLARPVGTREDRREWYKNRERYIGKYLEVKYTDINSATGCVTRFPVGLHFVKKS